MSLLMNFDTLWSMEDCQPSHHLQELEALRMAMEISEEEISACTVGSGDTLMESMHSLSQLQCDFFDDPYLDCARFDSKSLSLIEDLIGCLKCPSITSVMPSSTLPNQCISDHDELIHQTLETQHDEPIHKACNEGHNSNRKMMILKSQCEKEGHAKANNKENKLQRRIWGVKGIEIFDQIKPQKHEPKKALESRDEEHRMDASYNAWAGNVSVDSGSYSRPIAPLHPTDSIACHKNVDSSHDNTDGFMEPSSTIMNEIKWKKGCQKGPRPWNAAAERRRRKKLNDKLLDLRAVVPKISKMDKASIVIDAIRYMRELQSQVEKTQEEISHLLATKELAENGHLYPRNNNLKDSKTILLQQHHHHIMEMGVVFVEGKTYNLSISCKKSTNVLVQLTRALEDNEFEILSANLTSINDHILNSFIIEAKEEHLTSKQEVHRMIEKVLSKNGFYL